jgi:hypothetical protein
LARVLVDAGFRCVYATYWNTLLFPLMAIARKLVHTPTRPTSDVMLYPKPIDAFCRVVTSLESLVLRAGLKFPFGGSILAVAVKEDHVAA